MKRYIELKSCADCQYQDHNGAFAEVKELVCHHPKFTQAQVIPTKSKKVKLGWSDFTQLTFVQPFPDFCPLPKER